MKSLSHFLSILSLAGLVLAACADSRPVSRPVPAGSIVIDVRTAPEYARGHLPGALNLPHTEIETRIGTLVPDRNTPILVYCRSGRRSALARRILEDLGYVRVVDGGAYEDLRRNHK